MKTPNPTKILSLILLFIAAQVSLSYAGNLFIEPYAPFVAVGGTISLSVTNANGSVKWKAFHGEIEKTGNSVKYKAPDRVTIDGISAMDSNGNMGVVRVVVQEQIYLDELFSKENANWEVFTNRDIIQALLLSDDEKYLWVGTTGGLEKRDAETGESIQLFTNLDGLPFISVISLLSDVQNGLWVGTRGDGLAHYKSDGIWQVFNTENSGLPSNLVYSLLSDGQNGLWVGTYGGGFAHYKSDGSWQVFNKDNSGLQDNLVTSLLSDGQNGLWVGTENGGLAHYKSDGTWQVFNQDNSKLPGNYINSLLSDCNGGGMGQCH